MYPSAAEEGRAMIRAVLVRILPNPCRHDLAGRPHRTLGAACRCVERYGNPGVRVVPVEVVA